MTSIPVRKGTTVNRRSGALKENIEHSHGETNGRKHFQKENKDNHRILTRQSSKKELENENSQLHEEIHTYKMKLQNLESTLHTTQEQLKKSEEDSTKVKDTCERTLLSSNIDPVTFKKIAPNSEDDNEMQSRRNHTKVQVSILQEKLEQFNTRASACIKGLQEISAELDHSDCITTESTNSVIEHKAETLNL